MRVAFSQHLLDGAALEFVCQRQERGNHLAQLLQLAGQAADLAPLRVREILGCPAAQLFLEQPQVVLLRGKDGDHAPNGVVIEDVRLRPGLLEGLRLLLRRLKHAVNYCCNERQLCYGLPVRWRLVGHGPSSLALRFSIRADADGRAPLSQLMDRYVPYLSAGGVRHHG
ncbi:MAG: hypothetical protein M3380_00285, partial [Chloroflexota bacterium]|nr:hypothetical protein [Chloroflexota bacterium]